VRGGEVGLSLKAVIPATSTCPPPHATNLADRVFVWSCFFEDQDVGVWLESEGKVYLQNNVVKASNTATLVQAAGIFFPPRALPPENDKRVFYSILNNTIDVAGRPCLRVHMRSLDTNLGTDLQKGHVRLQVYNNILRATGTGGVCVEILDDEHWFLSNHNDFVFVSPAICARRVIGTPSSIPTLADWRLVNMGDKNSISMDPMFVNSTTGDYHLGSNPLPSPCANGATLLVYEPAFAAVDFDAAGDPRVWSGSFAGGAYSPRYLGIDIGADELRNAAPADDADAGMPFVRGDANDDGSVDPSDSPFITNFLFLGGPPPVCFDAADTNDDEVINISDAVFLSNYLFNNPAIPLSQLAILPPPFPACGFDVYRLGTTGTQSVFGPLHCEFVTTACP
jgi:hypothetical protein